MRKNKNKIDTNKLTAYLISILIHGLFLLIFIKISIGNLNHKTVEHSPIIFIESSPVVPKVKVNKTKPVIKKEVVRSISKPSERIIQTSKSDKPVVKVDTVIPQQEIKESISTTPDSSDFYLKYARTLLDTFLVRHPEYRKLILEDQAKELIANKNDPFYKRNELEKRIGEEISKYLRKNFPEGSEHELNPYTGPGVQIPIDGLIDAIKKIFN